MYYLVLVLATAVLAGGATVERRNRHNFLTDFDNHVQIKSVPEKKSKHFITLMSHPPKTNTHRPGTTLELTCDAIGAPSPSIRWFKNDAPVYEYDKESSDAIVPTNSSLARAISTLLVARVEEPVRYTCLIVAGSNTLRVNTLVYSTDEDNAAASSERERLVPLEPRILFWYKAYVDSIAQIARIPCAARGHPRPQVTWLNNRGVDVTLDSRMKVLRSGELVLSPVKWEDMGEFTCIATNIFGTAQVKTFIYPALLRD